MTDIYEVGSLVRVKPHPNLPEGFNDSWANVEGVVVGTDGNGTYHRVKVSYDPKGVGSDTRTGATFRLSNLELVSGKIINPTDSAVEHPAHYGGDTTYEVIKVVEAWGLGFVLGNVVKYVARAGKKPGNSELQDLKKARDYINKRIEKLEEN